MLALQAEEGEAVAQEVVSRHDARSRLLRYRYGAARISALLLSLGAFIALSVLVHQGRTHDLDQRLRQVFRPDDVWSTNQLIFGNVVDGLAPEVTAAILAVTATVVAWRRRSLRPLILMVFLGTTSALLVAASKVTFSRADPLGGVSGLGAYPSGHMVFLIACLGGSLMIIRLRTRFWHWAAVAATAVLMAVSLLFLAMHWFTDIVGGTLLGVIVLLLAAPTTLRDT